MRACVFAAEISCPGRAKLAAHGGTDSLVRPPHGSLVRAELSSRPTLALPRHLISPPLSRPPRLPRKKLPGDRRGRVSPARPAAPSAERPHASKAKRPCSAFAAPLGGWCACCMQGGETRGVGQRLGHDLGIGGGWEGGAFPFSLARAWGWGAAGRELSSAWITHASRVALPTERAWGWGAMGRELSSAWITHASRVALTTEPSLSLARAWHWGWAASLAQPG